MSDKISINLQTNQEQNPEQLNEFADNNILDNHSGSRIDTYHQYPVSFEEWIKKEGHEKVGKKRRVLIPLFPRNNIYDAHNRYISKISLDNWEGRTPRDVGSRWLVET